MRRQIPKTSFSFLKHLRRREMFVRSLLILCIVLLLGFLCEKECILKLRNPMIALRVQVQNLLESTVRFYSNFLFFICHDVDKTLLNLRIENAELRQQMLLIGSIQEENDVLRELLSLKKRSPERVVVAKVVTVFKGEFARSCVLSKGKESGIKIDNLVLNEHGLIGRVVEVRDGYSLVLLITDINSNIPAKIGEANVILNGDNSNTLRISLIHEDIPIVEGSIAETSSYSQKEKILIGKVLFCNGHFLVEPFVKLNDLTYVGVVTSDE